MSRVWSQPCKENENDGSSIEMGGASLGTPFRTIESSATCMQVHPVPFHVRLLAYRLGLCLVASVLQSKAAAGKDPGPKARHTEHYRSHTPQWPFVEAWLLRHGRGRVARCIQAGL